MRPIRPGVLALAATLALANATPAAALTKAAGFIAGFNFSNLNIETASGVDGQSSFAGGIALDLGFSDVFGLRVEPMFVSKGADATHHNAYWGTMDGVKFDLDYIDVPILARYELATSGSHGFLLGGIGVGFATKQKAELTKGTQNETVDFSGVFSSMDVSLNLGGGVTIPEGANRWTIDGRAAFGLMNINNGGTITFSGGPLTVPSTTTRTLGFRLFATYLLSL